MSQLLVVIILIPIIITTSIIIIIIIVFLSALISPYSFQLFFLQHFSAVSVSVRVRVLTVHRVSVALLAAAEALSMGQQERLQG